MMGFNKPTGGEVSIFGYDMSKDSSSAKKHIGYLPGNMKLYDKWTGWDHIRFFEGVRGKSKNVNDLIKRLNFDPTAKFRHLSSGNKQKLGLILALMNSPKLLIMDEPTVGLDPLLQNEIYKILLEMRKQGTTILISSHNLPEVEKLCDRVAIIKSGKIVATEQISELVKKKLHKVEVRFADKVKPGDFDIRGVEKVDEITGGLVLTISGDLNPLIAELSKYKVIDLELSHASLEDIFLKYYEGGL
ncbi:ABC transporter ATP-binding protein, partial [Candidatus Saccharibacteria bacterium]|nr:ABC transporter ATP-binding protein [Candidatus Saccharibacteria bacterium]